MDPNFSKLDYSSQRQLLAEILADDWAPIIRGVATAALPHIWSAVKHSNLGRKAMNLLRDYLGVELNDDNPGVLGPHFQRNLTTSRNIDWADFNPNYAASVCAFDGVNT